MRKPGEGWGGGQGVKDQLSCFTSVSFVYVRQQDLNVAFLDGPVNDGSLLPPQRSLFRGGPGPGAADRTHVRCQVHPQKGSQGEGEQHRERDRCAEKVSSASPALVLPIPGYLGNPASLSLLRALPPISTPSPRSRSRAPPPPLWKRFRRWKDNRYKVASGGVMRRRDGSNTRRLPGKRLSGGARTFLREQRSCLALLNTITELM